MTVTCFLCFFKKCSALSNEQGESVCCNNGPVRIWGYFRRSSSILLLLWWRVFRRWILRCGRSRRTWLDWLCWGWLLLVRYILAVFMRILCKRTLIFYSLYTAKVRILWLSRMSIAWWSFEFCWDYSKWSMLFLSNKLRWLWYGRMDRCWWIWLQLVLKFWLPRMSIVRLLISQRRWSWREYGMLLL